VRESRAIDFAGRLIDPRAKLFAAGQLFSPRDCVFSSDAAKTRTHSTPRAARCLSGRCVARPATG